MTLAVIGAGFGRTGTTSLKLALEMLGLGPCYHMTEVFKNPGHAELWSAAADGPIDWESLLAGYPSAVDWPSTFFWRELANLYPQAKVILSVRSTESWVKSVHQTIFRAIGSDIEDKPPYVVSQMLMARKLIFDKTFDGRPNDVPHISAVFEKHNDEVRRTIAPERLLVYQSSDGWEPLCTFLGVPVPDAPFPKANTTEEFQARMGSASRNP